MSSAPAPALAGTARRSARARTPFRPRTVVAVLVLGALAFLLLLYAMGQGWTGQDDKDGGAHAASNALNGYSALADLLRRRGQDVELSRSPASLDDENLLVLTPSAFTDAEDLAETIRKRRFVGPTLLVVSKWMAMPVDGADPKIKAKKGWVQFVGADAPEWISELDLLKKPAIVGGSTTTWNGLGRSGALPDPEQVQALTNAGPAGVLPIITDSEGDVLAGVLDDNGYYYDLYEAAGLQFSDEETEGQTENTWPVVVVFEPDLLNNYGLAREDRAAMAVALVEASMDGGEVPVVFDLTYPGLGASQNLLTLAFTPPFLAATLALILLGFIVGWRSLQRFGAARAEVAANAHGKTQLATNGARLVQRARRWHLLGEPYAALVAARIARTLGLRASDEQAREIAIDHALERIGQPSDFSRTAALLRDAERPTEIIRAARALKDIERTLSR